MIDCEVQEVLAELSSTGTTAKRLTLTAWNGKPAKLDLRTWRLENGETKPNKGLTLTREEAKALLDALAAFLSLDNKG